MALKRTLRPKIGEVQTACSSGVPGKTRELGSDDSKTPSIVSRRFARNVGDD